MDELHWITWHKVKPSYSIEQLKDIMAMKKEELEQDKKMTEQLVKRFEQKIWDFSLIATRTETPNEWFYVVNWINPVVNWIEINLRPYEISNPITLQEKKYISLYPTNLFDIILKSFPDSVLNEIDKQIKSNKDYNQKIDSKKIISNFISDYISLKVTERVRAKWEKMSKGDIDETLKELELWEKLWWSNFYNLKKHYEENSNKDNEEIYKNSEENSKAEKENS